MNKYREAQRKESYRVLSYKVENNSGVLLTPYEEYKNNRTPVKVICKHKHIFYPHPTTIMYRNSWCPSCTVAEAKGGWSFKETNREYIYKKWLLRLGYKQCTKCKKLKNITSFYSMRGGRIKYPCPKSKCKQCEAKITHKKNRERYNTDGTYRLNRQIANCMNYSLKRNDSGKNKNHWETLVNFNLNQLIQHLEVQFKEGMSWDNYGKWHVDHKIPTSLWRFSDYNDSEFKQCWTLANLQPMWAKENMTKGNTYCST